MWKPWEWGRGSNLRAVDNARTAAVVLSRARVERADVEIFLAEHAALRPGTQPAAPWPA